MVLKSIKQRIMRLVDKYERLEIQEEKDEGALIDFYRQFIAQEDLCFDIGANVGTRTDLWLQLGARVICVEPQPDCVEILRSKYGGNPSVEILQAGLASKPGVMTLSVCREANTLSTFSEKWKTGRFKSYRWEAQYDVTMTTLDEMVQRYGVPGFCKIDVEGFELEVIKGLSVPIGCLSFEFTSEFLKDAKKCAEHLESLGKVEFNFAFGDNLSTEPKLAREDWLNSQLLYAELNQIPSSLLWGDIYARYSLP